jgi:hypothetical protein
VTTHDPAVHLVDVQPTPATRFAEVRLRTMLKRFQWAHMQVAREAGVWFWAMPDFSPSLNEARIRAGYPVGGLLHWAATVEDILPAHIGVNGCGMLVARVPSSERAADTLRALPTRRIQLPIVHGTQVRWDLGRKNHFLSLYTSDSAAIVVMHCSAPEIADRFGDLDFTEIETPHGPIDVYVGKQAELFREAAAKQETYARAKRAELTREIFGDIEICFNAGHMSLVDETTAGLGCYAGTTPLADVPVAVGPGKSLYLVDSTQPTTLPWGADLHLVPHGTGNTALNDALSIEYSDTTSLLEVRRTPAHVQHFDTATDVFDGHNPAPDWLLDAARGATGSLRAREYRPLVETKLRRAYQ